MPQDELELAYQDYFIALPSTFDPSTRLWEVSDIVATLEAAEAQEAA